MIRRLGPLAAAAVLTAGAAAAAPSATNPRPWSNPKLSPERRAALLQQAMTLDEELALVHGGMPLFMKNRAADVLMSAGHVPGIPRLGIPPLKESDASLGVANAGRGQNDEATALPSGLALAATWNPKLAYEAGAMIGKEALQKGFNVLLAGGVDLERDPRNGRNFEYVGEDPLLAGVIAGESIRGIQSNHIISTAKHFVLNDQETGRMVLNAVIDPAAFRESDLLAFEIAIEHGRPGSVMCAYNRINGVYGCENSETFAVLKNDWGWKGWIMSDWGAVHSTEAAALAGLDQESGEQLDKQAYFAAPLKAAVAAGQVPRARLDDMVRRILWGMFSTGVMDHPSPAGSLDVAGDSAVAERAAAEAVVLLKNDHGLLPLAAGAKRIAVIGGHADVGVISGGGSSQVVPVGSTRFPPPTDAPEWGGGVIFHPSAPLAAIRKAFAGAEISFDPGTDPVAAAAAAKAADVVVVFATQWSTEGRDTPLSLTDDQDALVAAVAAANPRTVVVLETGNPIFMPWLDRVGAVIEVWYPGQKGGEVIAGVLSGRINPSGRLPISFPNREADLPNPRLPGADVAMRETLVPNPNVKAFDVHFPEGADVGYRWYARRGVEPLFPFGYGLSYTHFRYSGLKVTGGRTFRASFTVTNTGGREGAETAQVYATPPRMTPRLVGWKKITLKPGQSARLTVVADRRLIARFDTGRAGWRVAAGDYSIAAGPSSSTESLKGRARLQASTLAP